MMSEIARRGGVFIGLFAVVTIVLGMWGLRQRTGIRIAQREARMEPQPVVY